MKLDEFNINRIYLVACNEFLRFIKHPLVMVISGILLVLALLNGIGGSPLLAHINDNGKGDIFVGVGLSQIMYTSALFCTTMAIFIGFMSIAYERSKGSLLTILAKPILRRDIVTGKFIGINAFILVLITANLAACSLLIMLFYRPPVFFEDFIIRLFTSVLLLFLECSLVTGITMLIGIIIKNTLFASIVAITYLYVDWYVSPTSYVNTLSLLSPKCLLFDILLYNPQIKLLDTSMPYGDWLNVTSPYIVFLLLEIVAILAFNCIMLTRSEE
jgi:ABC-2 type transport system permease protein